MWEDGRCHPRLLAVVVVYAQRWYLESVKKKHVSSITQSPMVSQRWHSLPAACDPIFGILPAVTRITFRDHRLGRQRSEKQPSLVGVDNVPCLVTITENGHTFSPICHGVLGDVGPLASQDQTPDVVASFPVVQPSVQPSEVIVAETHRKQDGILDHHAGYGNIALCKTCPILPYSCPRRHTLISWSTTRRHFRHLANGAKCRPSL